MSVLVNKDTRLLVQGITGREGEFHTRQMIAYGTKVVGGMTPGKGGEWAAGVPVFDTVKEAVRATGALAPWGAAEAAAVGRGGPPKIEGAPVCLFHASQSRTSDMVNTTHRRVRRISVMTGSWRKTG